jgi:hypothetical protein
MAAECDVGKNAQTHKNSQPKCGMGGCGVRIGHSQRGVRVPKFCCCHGVIVRG